MTPTQRRVRTAVRLALVVALLGGGYAYALSPRPVDGGLSIPACATEDSTNCVWNAATMGNATGNSFIDIDGTAYYFSN